MRTNLSPIAADSIVQRALVPGGAYWSGVVSRWSTLRIVDRDGRGSGSCLFYNARETTERYNAPDTVKIQNQIFLTEPMALFSDLGRIMFAIAADTAGCHETLCGATTAQTNAAKYLPRTYSDARNGYVRNARDNFVAALGRHGLGARDIVMPFNLWQRVEVGDDGRLNNTTDGLVAGIGIDLRAEMDVLAVISNTPHVLDRGLEYAPGPLEITIWSSSPPVFDDPCRTGTPERSRGAANSDILASSGGSSR